MYYASHSLLVMALVDGATVTPGLQTLRILGHALNWHPFTQDLSLAIDRIFPTKIVKIHCTDKPRMTPWLNQLINKRQRAFHSGDRDLWRHYRSKVKKRISLKKRSFYTNMLQHLKSCNPQKWWDSVKSLSGKKCRSNNPIRIVKDSRFLSLVKTLLRY